MKKGVIPHIINNFHIYRGDGNDISTPMLGISGEITLPDLSAITETISGSGILGELEVKNPGHFSAINMDIPFIGYTDDMFKIDPTEFTMLTLRSCSQSQVKATRELVYNQMKIVLGGTTKDYKLGTVKIGSQMGSSISLSIDYIKIDIDGTVALELDKLNEVFTVLGEDKLARIRDMC